LPLRQVGIVAGVLILVGAVLFLKTRQSSSASPAMSSDIEKSTPPIADTPEATSTPAPNLLPEAQLDRLLQAGEPVFVFFHSNTCTQCIRMTGIVEEVYPDFSDSVALIDVNVYDERNKSLLQRANIRAIPTLIFIDGEGEVGGRVGVMEPDALREQLRKLGEE
jgi:thiol-disulfide isomerase/thioredoxin